MEKCKLCGNEVPDEELTEISILPPDSDTPLDTVYVCKECMAKLQPILKDENTFNTYLKNMLEDMEKNWEKGTKENSGVGSVIRIIQLKDEADQRYTGKIGTITHIDDAGQLWGTWGGLAVIPDIDKYLVLKGDNNGKED